MYFKYNVYCPHLAIDLLTAYLNGLTLNHQKWWDMALANGMSIKDLQKATEKPIEYAQRAIEILADAETMGNILEERYAYEDFQQLNKKLEKEDYEGFCEHVVNLYTEFGDYYTKVS